MSGDALRRVRITGVHTPRLEWAVGREVSLPTSLLGAVNPSSDVANLDLRAIAPPSLNGLSTHLRLRAAFTEQRPHSTRLPFSYQRVPALVRWYIARQMGRGLRARRGEWSRYPDWPIDLSADFVDDWMAADEPLPAPSPAPVLLTHDIDSLQGLRNLVNLFLPIEEAAGARSTCFVVPCGGPLDHGLLREVIARGHDIGVHGYDHSNRTAFLDAKQRRQRLSAGRDALAMYSPRGYRAPSLIRTAPLIEDLGDYYLYDSSIPTSGGPFPVFNNGCATVRPFRIGRTLELPITLRRDGSLMFMGYAPSEIGAMWLENARTVAAARGIVMLLTHCESRFSGNPGMLAAYRQFVEFIASSRAFEWSMPHRVAADAARV
jgi:peptidoglycan/xylan/chitin deacetylase (PgdA/CDA1 family)